MLALKKAYPEFQWRVDSFSQYIPEIEYWQQDRKNIEQYIDTLATDLGITKPTGWYRVQAKDIEKRNGKTLLQLYDYSISKLLQDIYPNERDSYSEDKFLPYTKQYWSSLTHQKQLFDHLTNQLNSSKGEREYHIWYSVEKGEIAKLLEASGGDVLLEEWYGGSLEKALMAVYPEYRWQPWRFK